ncbi:MAG: hypothetical protein GY906_39100 [bacterium]|nr:hypothetical protein [bacterium]
MDSGGMTLRDYFAAAALTGCLANQYTRNESGNRDTEYFLAIADAVYAVADAMIIARAKEPPDANQ